MISFFSYETGTGPMHGSCRNAVHVCAAFNYERRTRKIISPPWCMGRRGGGGRVLMELLPLSFDVLQYLEMIFPSVGSLWSSLQDIWGIFWGWWRRWRTVTSALNIVAILDFISIGNSMICCDIWHKYHKWYFEFVIRNFTSVRRWNLRQFWNITSGIYAKYHVQIMLLTTLKDISN